MKRIVLIIICIISITNTLQAQTTYTYTGTGDWTDTANWSPSYPGLFIPNGDTAIISAGSQATVPNGSGGIGIEGRIDIDGILIINTTSSFSTIGPLFNIRINSTGTLVNNSTIFNDGNFRNAGKLINNGFINNDRLFQSSGSDFNNQNVIRNRTGGEMTLSNNSPFVNMNSGIINDFGGQLTLVGLNNLTGNFSNSGSITFFNAGFYGTLTNTDTGTIASPASNFTIQSGGTIINDGTINSIRNFTISNGGTLTNSGFLNINNFTFTISSGAILTNSTTGAITNNATLNTSSLGTLINDGTLLGNNISHTGNFSNAGIVSPGNSIGTYTFNMGYTHQSTAILTTEIESTSNFDAVTVTTAATLSGTLDVSLVNGFTPSVGDTFTILTANSISGTFTTTNLPAGYNWNINYTATEVILEVSAPTFTAPADICEQTAIQNGLDGGLPIGGVYSGPGVTDDGNGMTYSFNPTTSGVGTHTLTYTQSGTSAMDDIEVFAAPTVAFTAPPNLAVDAGIQTGLSGGTPAVSILSTTVVLNLDYEDVFGPGSGVTEGEIVFDPSGAMLSTDLIFFGNANGNVAPLINATASGATITLDFENGPIGNIVADGPIIGATGNLNFISGTDLIIDGDDFGFVSASGTASSETVGSGIYAGPGVTNEASGTLYNFDPAVAGIGTHTIEYTFTDDNGCAATASDTIEVFTEMSEFITTWKTDNPGTSNDNQITIPAIGGNYTVDWGDMSTPDTNISGAITHTYTTAGTYTVTISGTFSTIFFNNGGDREKILTVENWGDPVWNSMARAFHGCTNLVINAPDSPDLSQVTSMAGMFDGATAMNQDIGDWDVSNVQNMNGMFRNTPFNQDISSWDVSNVSDFAFMFDGASAFNQDLSAWGTRLGSADNMASMFRNATNFNGAIENWDVTTVTNMVGMFEGTAFNRNINNWDVSNVNNMAFMFSDATAFNQPLTDWGTRLGNVTDMTNMFEGATAFNQDISNWDVSTVQLMAGMFSGATSFNIPIGAWGANTASVVNMEFMFNEATSFDQDLGSWNVENVSNMTAMFFGVTLSSDNYDSLLTGWSTQTLQNDVEFDAGDSGYCTAEAARQSIIDNFNWDIIDIGPENIPPVISDCPTDIMVPEPANPADCGAIATFTTPTATDNCSTATITQVAGPTSGSFFPSGTTVVTFEAVDEAGNVATCSFNVIVANSTPPVAVCQPFTLQLDANGVATLNPEDVDGGSTDDCNILNLSVSPNSFSCADVGTPQMVTLTVDDGSGNIDTCTTMVTIEDTVAPTILCEDITVELDMSGTITLDPASVIADLSTFEIVLISGDNQSNLPGSSDITVPITDDVTITFDWTYATDDGVEFDPFGYLLNGVFTELTDIAGDDFNQSGTETVMLTNGDVFGFSAFTLDNTFGAATATVTNFQPSLQGQLAPANWTETLIESDGSASINENAAIFDACGIASITMSQTTFTTADIGDNPVTYTITDVNNNSETCDAIVTILSINDMCASTTTYTIAGGWDNGTPTTSTRAVITEDYNTATMGLGDINACELIITTEATLTISDGNTVSVENDITINGTLDVANTGSVVQVQEDAVTINNGSIAVAKTTPTLDDRNFVAMSSPVTAEARDRVYGNSRAVFSLIPSNFVPFAIDFVVFPEFEFAENFLDDNNDYLVPVTGSTATPPAGIGQLIFPQPEPNVGDGAYTLTYTQDAMHPGTLNSGTISVPINYNGPATTNNYNLLGNPYASAIDVTAFINANDAVNEVYYWDHITNPTAALPGFGTSNFSMNDISIRNAMMGIAAVNGGTAPGQFMASGQGFGIKADQAEMMAATPVIFTNSIRVTGNNDGFRSSETPTGIDKLWLNLTTTAFDEAIAQTGIGFTPDATPAIDKGYDSPRVGTFLSLFTTLDSGELLGIQARETFDADIEITLGFSTSIEASTPYTISIGNLEGIAIENASVFIIDHYVNTIVNVNEQSYTFTAQKGLHTDRFTIVFQDRDALSVDGESFRESGINIYPNPSQGQITLAYAGASTLENAVITDINGKIIKRIDLSSFNQTQTIDLGHLAKGMYFMQITSQENSVIKKLMIRY